MSGHRKLRVTTAIIFAISLIAAGCTQKLNLDMTGETIDWAESDFNQPAIPGSVFYFPTGKIPLDRLRATVDGRAATLLPHSAPGLSGILIPPLTGRLAEIEILEGSRVIVKKKLRVENPGYVRLLLTLEEARLALASATRANGAPLVKRLDTASGRLLSLTLYDLDGNPIYRKLVPFPGANGDEIHGLSKSGELARSDPVGKLYFSTKVPYFADRFAVHFEEIAQADDGSNWSAKSLDRLEVRL